MCVNYSDAENGYSSGDHTSCFASKSAALCLLSKRDRGDFVWVDCIMLLSGILIN
jgi:hypothetical protein